MFIAFELQKYIGELFQHFFSIPHAYGESSNSQLQT